MPCGRKPLTSPPFLPVLSRDIGPSQEAYQCNWQQSRHCPGDAEASRGQDLAPFCNISTFRPGCLRQGEFDCGPESCYHGVIIASRSSSRLLRSTQSTALSDKPAGTQFIGKQFPALFSHLSFPAVKEKLYIVSLWRLILFFFLTQGRHQVLCWGKRAESSFSLEGNKCLYTRVGQATDAWPAADRKSRREDDPARDVTQRWPVCDGPQGTDSAAMKQKQRQ